MLQKCKIKGVGKKAELLPETTIFIILNVLFFGLMVGFVYLQGSSVHLSEEEAAKKIALVIDSAKPGMEIEINLGTFFDRAGKEGIVKESSIEIDNAQNLVIVHGSKDSFFEYSYFNDVNVKFGFAGDYLKLEVVK
jgi:hypothetical protein